MSNNAKVFLKRFDKNVGWFFALVPLGENPAFFVGFSDSFFGGIRIL